MLINHHQPGRVAPDLGFPLHNIPANLFCAELPFGKAFVLYSAAKPTECTACVLLELDPFELVSGAHTALPTATYWYAVIR